MENSHIELAYTPDWKSDKAIAFDLDPKALVGANVKGRFRVFIPKSQTVEKGGVTYASRWILGKKIEELEGQYPGGGPRAAVSYLLGDRSIDVPRNGGHAPKAAAFDASGLIEFFDHAAETIKWPKVRFPEGVVFARQGGRARYAFGIKVDDGGPYGANDWYGTIDREGRFIPGRDCTPEVQAVVNRFADDPVAEAVRAGKASGNCVFCRSGLTTDGSVAHGYGPVCAKNWALPWSRKV